MYWSLDRGNDKWNRLYALRNPYTGTTDAEWRKWLAQRELASQRDAFRGGLLIGAGAFYLVERFLWWVF